MADEIHDSREEHSTQEIVSSSQVVFSVDPNTLLFQTHKSEDVGILQDRVSLLEIHELLMEINLDLIPPVRVILRAYTFYAVALAATCIMTLLMLFLQEFRVMKLILYAAVMEHVWLLGVIMIRKKIFDKIITTVIRNKEDLYNSRGLTWKLDNSYFTLCGKSSCCSLVLHSKDAEDEREDENGEEAQQEQCVAGENTLTFAKGNTSRKIEPTTRRKSKVGFNFTLGTGASKNVSTLKIPNYVAIDVVGVESNRFRKPSM